MTTPSERETELLKLNFNIVEKTIFMLLTASTASIAYILTQVSELVWSNFIYLPIASLLFLGLSFLAGSISLDCMARMTQANAKAMSFGGNPGMYKALMDIVKKIVKRLNILLCLQRYLFLGGATTYAIYVFWSIYLKAPIS